MTTGEKTTYYYLADRRVAMRKGTDLQYIHQDYLTSTAVVTSDNGTQVGSIKYYPYGDCRNSTGDLGTDKLFTGQRLDDTGLYYYGARYYDAGIGRFISADSIIPDPMNPQAFNRYSYVINNPLKYIDPTGRQWDVWASPEDLISIGQGSMPENTELELELYEGRDEWGYDVAYGQNPSDSSQRTLMLMPREGGGLNVNW